MFRHRSVLAAVLTLVCAFAGLATPLHAAENDALNQRFKEANAKVDAGEYQPALEIYNEILEAEPKAGNVWVMRAIAKWTLKDKSGARADLAQAINLHPDNVDAYRMRGQFRYQAEDFDGSLADFNKAIELTHDDPNPELFGMRAEVEKKLNNHPAAIHDLTQALELKPDYTAALYLRGQLYEAGGEPDAAEADYSKVIELDPKHADARNNRAWIRFHALKWDGAIADGKKALEIAPGAAVALRVVGYAQFAKGDYAAAAETLAQAADADAEASTGAYALFIRHHALSRVGGADKRVANAIGNWKDDAWVQTIAKFVAGQISEDEFETAAKETSDDGELLGRACELHFYIGLARKQAGDKSTARLRFKSALGTDQKTYIEHALASAELKRL